MTVSTTPDDALRGWALVRVDGTFIAADDSFARLLGFGNADELRGASWHDIAAPESALALGRIERGARYGLPWNGPLQLLGAGGAIALQAEARSAEDAVALLVTGTPATPVAPHPSASAVAPSTRRGAHPSGDLAAEINADLLLILRAEHGGRLTVTRAIPGAVGGIVGGESWTPDGAELAVIESGEPAIDGALAVRRNDASPLARLPAYGMRSALRVPLYEGGTVVGLAVAYSSRPNAFAVDDVWVLEQATRHLGATLGAPADTATGAASGPVAAPSDRLATLAEVMAGIAHELNNPLAAVAGYAQVLRSLPPAELLRALDVIEAEALRAGRVVSDLLAFTQSNAPVLRPVDLDALVRGLVDRQRPELEATAIEVELDLGSLPLVRGDEAQLERALDHLVANARQAMQRTGGTLCIRTALDGGVVRLEMEDTGPSIPPGLYERVFDPFFMARDVGDGSGLGLAVVYGSVVSHGGRVWVETPVDGGARFVLELPLARAGAPANDASISRPPLEDPPPAPVPPRVLVVDDEESIRALATQVLATFGYEATTAPSGEAALELLEAGRFDAIVTDIRMPGMGGIAFYGEVARRWPALAGRVVIMTGDLENDAVAALVREAGLAALEKPFRLEALRAALSQALPRADG